jgi:NADH-quinone oxidoreductase E subunit
MLNQEELKKVEEIKKRYPTSQAALMPVLYLIQEKYGWISEESIKYISGLLEIPEKDVLGVVSFYEMFRSKPKGKYLIEVCTNVSCMLCNSKMVKNSLEKKLGIKMKETTSDSKFTLEEVECLGSCGTAPVISINDQYYDNLTEEKINKIIDSLE